MYLVYATLGLTEVFLLLVSAAAFAFLIVRGIFRALFAPKDETTKPAPQNDYSHKRADSRSSG
jgi:hypothetical protein